jgi:hypothetical protein
MFNRFAHSLTPLRINTSHLIIFLFMSLRGSFGCQVTSSVQETGRSRGKYVIYGLSLILIIVLSTSTALFYLSNQSLQKDLDSSRLQELSWAANDVNNCIGLFVGRYYDQFQTMNYTINYNTQADNASKLQNAYDVLKILRNTAIEVYGNFKNYIQRIELLTNNVNQTAYENISQTVYTALGQLHSIDHNYYYPNYTGNQWMLGVSQLLGQFYNIIGIDKEVGLPTSGLLAIAANFQNLGNSWSGYIAPPPETSLTMALTNATELQARLTAWGNYTTPIISWS